MKISDKTREQLLKELEKSNKRIAELEKSEVKRKQAKEALKDSNEKFKGLSEATFEAIFLSDKGICIEQNLSAKKMFGYTDEEAIGRYGIEWIIPEDRKKVMDNMLKGYEKPYEATALRKDGTTFPCILLGKMIHFKERDIRVTSLTDITERKQAEEALRESEKRFRLLADNQSDVIWTRDLELKITYVSPSTFKQTGFTVAEKMIQPITEAYTAESVGVITRIFTEELKLEREGTADPDRSRIFDLESYRKDGSIFWIEFSVSFLRDENGAAIGLIGVSRDITERKQAEEELKQKMKQLERFNKVAVDRELRMIELKREINDLLEKAGLEKKYSSPD